MCYTCPLLYHAWVVYESTKKRRKVKMTGGKCKGKEESIKERRKVQRKGRKYKGKEESTKKRRKDKGKDKRQWTGEKYNGK
jgi:hypothetical protein